jgi:regulator of protease activity HflC (stomatin/prohibitin superfamily)
MFFWLTVVVFGTLWLLAKTFTIVPMREAVVKERLGKFAGVLPPGLHFMLPFIDRAAYRHEMREQCIDIPAQGCITRDNIQLEVDGIVYLKVVDAAKASYGIGNYRRAAINLAQTTMRAEIGKLSLDETFSERESINEAIIREIDKASAPWGVKMIRYEIRNISPSPRVIETMEKQMEAERQKRASIVVSSGAKEAKIQQSEGERQEAVNLSEGEKTRRINEAEGRAAEIRLVAEAQAEGARLIAEAVRKPGGELALRTQLVEAYLQEFGRVIETADVSVVPTEIAGVQSVFEGISRVTTAAKK